MSTISVKFERRSVDNTSKIIHSRYNTGQTTKRTKFEAMVNQVAQNLAVPVNVALHLDEDRRKSRKTVQG